MKIKNILAIAGGIVGVAAVVAGGAVAVRRHKMNDFIAQSVTLPEAFTYTAHTGCMGTEENSLNSIDAAVKYGAGIAEFDLNFTENGDPVLAHDAPKGDEITLDEAFKKVSEYDNLRVNVDIKSTAALDKVRPLAEKYGIEKRIFYTGVHDGFLDAVCTNGGGVEYYLNVDVEPEAEHTQAYLTELMQKVKDSGAIGINFNKKNASKALVDAFHANGLLVSVWTVDSEYDMYRVLSYAPDNITTRHPDKLSEAIKSLR